MKLDAHRSATGKDGRHAAVRLGLNGVLVLFGAAAGAVPAIAGTVFGTYTDLPLATNTDLTATGTLDWVKFGINGGGPGWTAVSKAGVSPLISRTPTPVGVPPAGTNVVLIGIASPANVLGFNWSDGNSPAVGSSNTIVTETILPAQNA